MRIVVIGGTGHVGSYLIPRLVALGHEVICLSRGQQQPYHEHAAWKQVERIQIDRQAAEKQGKFGEQVAALNPEAVVDMICYTVESARELVTALTGNIQHFLFTGTIWVHGHSTVVPADEGLPRRPFGSYGIQKAQIESFLLAEARQKRFPATILHPGHIVGPGWAPINPAGHFDPQVFERLATGQTLLLPNLGLETVHHVHADDVAQAFVRALEGWSTAVGESFHIVSPAALTLRGYAEQVASWFGRQAVLEYLPWEQWEQTESEQAAITRDHITHSPNCSIEKARRLIGYEPRYSSLEAVHEALQWLIANDQITIGRDLR